MDVGGGYFAMAEADEGIKLRVGSDDEGCELRLADVRTLSDFAEELGGIMDACQPTETIRVALLPPLPAGLSARSAFKMVVDTWTAADSASRPAVECVVASETVLDALIALLPGRDESEATFQFGTLRLCVVEGDITAVGADAIVNASNTSLRLGGGVSAAIRQACGPGLAAEMAGIARRHPLGDGDAVVTGSHGLKTARHIIHAASAAGDPETVARSLRNVLRLSSQHKFNSVAMPALGTGTGGMAMGRFAELLAAEVIQHVRGDGAGPRLLRLVLYRRSDAEIVVEILRRLVSESA